MEGISYLQDLAREMVSEINSKKDSMFLEGLKLKGFEFDNRMEIEEFINSRCRCEDNTHHKEQVYYVDNTPFLVYDYSLESKIDWDNAGLTTICTITSGSYRFV